MLENRHDGPPGPQPTFPLFGLKDKKRVHTDITIRCTAVHLFFYTIILNNKHTYTRAGMVVFLFFLGKVCCTLNSVYGSRIHWFSCEYHPDFVGVRFLRTAGVLFCNRCCSHSRIIHHAFMWHSSRSTKSMESITTYFLLCATTACSFVPRANQLLFFLLLFFHPLCFFRPSSSSFLPRWNSDAGSHIKLL